VGWHFTIAEGPDGLFCIAIKSKKGLYIAAAVANMGEEDLYDVRIIVAPNRLVSLAGGHFDFGSLAC